MALPKKKPRIEYWRDRVDGMFTTVHACRAWDEPSNGVFVLVMVADCQTWTQRRQIEQLLDVKLARREQAHAEAFGHTWRRHLTAMQFWGHDDHLEGPFEFEPWPAAWTPAA